MLNMLTTLPVIIREKQKALPQQGGAEDGGEAPAPEAAPQDAAPRVPPPAAAQPEAMSQANLEGPDLQVVSGVLKELGAIRTMLTGGGNQG